MNTAWVFPVGLAVLLVLGAWCGLRVRAEYRTRSELTFTTVAAVWVLYSLHFALTALAAAQSTWLLPVPRWLSIGGGLFFLLLGTVVTLAAMVSFRSLKRMSGMDSSRLITGGVYRWSRNPQNVGWTFFLVGIGLLRASGLVLLMAALFWLGFRMYLPLEEQLLERLFGDSYRAYRSHTHRYFGLSARPGRWWKRDSR